MRTVVFDLDGTLVDTSADMIHAANAVFAARNQGTPLDPVKDALTAFQGGRAMLRLGYERLAAAGLDLTPESQYLADYPGFLEQYGANIDVHSRLYPGAVDAVSGLKSMGYRLAICTNKPENLAIKLLDLLGVSDLFGAIIGADTGPTRKPDPAPYFAAVEGVGGTIGQSYLLGDTQTDRKTAYAANVPCALVTFGPAGDGVSALQPDALLPQYSDLFMVTQGLIG